MICIDEDTPIKKEIPVTKSGKNQRIHIPLFFEENGYPDLTGQKIVLNLDKEHRIVFYKY